MVISHKIKKEKHKRIKLLRMPFFKIGDIVSLAYVNKALTLYFKGLCMGKKLKSFKHKNASFRLRAVLNNVGIELQLSLFFVKIRNLEVHYFEKKRVFYKQAKLYYLRKKTNKSSLVKIYD